ncbi:cell wall hydrolase [Ancylobacter sp. 6x-1]|uniref:Cell wall hydrolase n=1 Tax=Ancylobacter crimeensis TaxID=2579147 RepID=A0ABT0D855_9HYPH|nr:cell wall hydrolase [Ancylobacter crimeensis]MCK0195977.1 cell wall hydrolase [Ancylobacter crimeensis]
MRGPTRQRRSLLLSVPAVLLASLAVMGIWQSRPHMAVASRMTALASHEASLPLADRARIEILAGGVHELRVASFAWPAPSLAINPASRFHAEVNRESKSDRRPLAQIAIPDIGAGVAADSRTATGISAATANELSRAGSYGVGTQTDDQVETANLGDPTGDPSDIETAASAPAETAGIGVDDRPDGSHDTVAARGTAIAVQSALAATLTAPDPNMAADDAMAQRDASLISRPIYRDAALVFGADAATLPPQFFEYGDEGGRSYAKGNATGADSPFIDASPAERLGLDGARRDRAQKCLAEAVYFESRGEPERGQIAVAQVVMNRVFSGYYPADVCRAVYQNANRRFACQFTFACDTVRDVVTEPDMWQQAQRIAADMLDGKLWDEQVGKATHYHAQSVHPRWVREMRKLDEIGEHTFYRPRRWG